MSNRNGGKGLRFGGKALMTVSALAVFLTLGLAGCGSDSGTNSESGGGGNIVLGSGQAWMIDDESGFIFNEDKSFLTVVMVDDEYYSVPSGTWSISGSTLSLNYSDGDVISGAYKVSGNTLTVGNLTLTKTSGVNAVPLNPGSGGGNANIVLGSGQAWMIDDESGFIFNADKTFETVVSVDGEYYSVLSGTWSISGSTLSLNYSDGDVISGAYNVSGNTLTIGNLTLTKESGINTTFISKRRQGGVDIVSEKDKRLKQKVAAAAGSQS
ncbi:hypothetical protein R80B4_02173 [Fibrobacteres bacterium R8-0-B4]